MLIWSCKYSLEQEQGLRYDTSEMSGTRLALALPVDCELACHLDELVSLESTRVPQLQLAHVA